MIENKIDYERDVQVVPGEFFKSNSGFELKDFQTFGFEYFKNYIQDINITNTKELSFSAHYVYYGIDEFPKYTTLYVSEDGISIRRYLHHQLEVIAECDKKDVDDYDVKFKRIISKCNNLYHNYDKLNETEYGESELGIFLKDDSVISLPYCLHYIITDLADIIPNKKEFTELLTRFEKIISTRYIESDAYFNDEYEYEKAIKYKKKI